MRDGKKSAENNANASHGNVCNAQERILTADHSSSRDDDGFGTTVDTHREV